MFTDEEDESSLGAVRYPCMPSLVALQQMRNRLHLAYLGRKLMKWTALATGRELRRIAMEMHSIYDSFAEDLGNAFMLLARGRYFYPNLNKMVLENCPAKASVVVGGRGRMITGVKVMRYEIVESGFEPYEHLGIEKGGQQIHEAKLAWLELLKRMILMQELRNSFMLVEEAHKNATKKGNVLSKVIAPRLIVTCHYINSELEEKEREETFRLKRVKQKKENMKLHENEEYALKKAAASDKGDNISGGEPTKPRKVPDKPADDKESGKDLVVLRAENFVRVSQDITSHSLSKDALDELNFNWDFNEEDNLTDLFSNNTNNSTAGTDQVLSSESPINRHSSLKNMLFIENFNMFGNDIVPLDPNEVIVEDKHNIEFKKIDNVISSSIPFNCDIEQNPEENSIKVRDTESFPSKDSKIISKISSNSTSSKVESFIFYDADTFSENETDIFVNESAISKKDSKSFDFASISPIKSFNDNDFIRSARESISASNDLLFSKYNSIFAGSSSMKSSLNININDIKTTVDEKLSNLEDIQSEKSCELPSKVVENININKLNEKPDPNGNSDDSELKILKKGESRLRDFGKVNLLKETCEGISFSLSREVFEEQDGLDFNWDFGEDERIKEVSSKNMISDTLTEVIGSKVTALQLYKPLKNMLLIDNYLSLTKGPIPKIKLNEFNVKIEDKISKPEIGFSKDNNIQNTVAVINNEPCLNEKEINFNNEEEIESPIKSVISKRYPNLSGLEGTSKAEFEDTLCESNDLKTIDLQNNSVTKYANSDIAVNLPDKCLANVNSNEMQIESADALVGLPSNVLNVFAIEKIIESPYDIHKYYSFDSGLDSKSGDESDCFNIAKHDLVEFEGTSSNNTADKQLANLRPLNVKLFYKTVPENKNINHDSNQQIAELNAKDNLMVQSTLVFENLNVELSYKFPINNDNPSAETKTNTVSKEILDESQCMIDNEYYKNQNNQTSSEYLIEIEITPTFKQLNNFVQNDESKLNTITDFEEPKIDNKDTEMVDQSREVVEMTFDLDHFEDLIQNRNIIEPDKLLLAIHKDNSENEIQSISNEENRVKDTIDHVNRTLESSFDILSKIVNEKISQTAKVTNSIKKSMVKLTSMIKKGINEKIISEDGLNLSEKKAKSSENLLAIDNEAFVNEDAPDKNSKNKGISIFNTKEILEPSKTTIETVESVQLLGVDNHAFITEETSDKNTTKKETFTLNTKEIQPSKSTIEVVESVVKLISERHVTEYNKSIQDLTFTDLDSDSYAVARSFENLSKRTLDPFLIKSKLFSGNKKVINSATCIKKKSVTFLEHLHHFNIKRVVKCICKSEKSKSHEITEENSIWGHGSDPAKSISSSSEEFKADVDAKSEKLSVESKHSIKTQVIRVKLKEDFYTNKNPYYLKGKKD